MNNSGVSPSILPTLLYPAADEASLDRINFKSGLLGWQREIVTMITDSVRRSISLGTSSPEIARKIAARGRFEIWQRPALQVRRRSGAGSRAIGPAIIDRINRDRGRINPAFQVNASAGTDVYRSNKVNVRLQADGQNLDDVLHVIDFCVLF